MPPGPSLELIIYEHAAFLAGMTPYEASRTAGSLFEAHFAAWKTYRHAKITVGIDLYNLEPEAWGVAVPAPSGTAIPCLGSPLVESVGGLGDLPPLDPSSQGRLAAVIEAGVRLRERCGGARVLAPVCGPFALAAGLMGPENLLCEAFEDSEKASGGLLRLLRAQEPYLRAIAEAGLGIAIFESGAAPPMSSPDMFRSADLPALREQIATCTRLSGGAPDCIIGGRSETIAADIAACRPAQMICPSEADQPAFVAAASAFPEVETRVNMLPTVWAGGGDESIRREYDRVAALAAEHPRGVVGSGVLPYDTSPERVLSLLKSLGESGKRFAIN